MNLVAVLTSPRFGGTDYLAQTLAHLERAGLDSWDKRFVFSDGPLVARPDGWPVIEHQQRSGNREAMWRVLRYAAEVGAERLLFLEDDITVCKNMAVFARHLVIDDAWAFVSLFDAFKRVTDSGFVPIPVRDFLFNQALVFPARTIQWLAHHDPKAVQIRRQVLHGSDEVIARLLMRSSWKTYALHQPHLVQHQGAVSAVRGRLVSSRISKLYVGDDFDALSLCEADKGTRA